MQNSRDDRIKILLVQTAFLGDIILTTPLIIALKKSFPESHLALLTTPTGEEALSGLPELDEIITYDKHNSEKGALALFKKASGIREKQFDIAISPHRSYRTALLLALSRIPVLVGFKTASLSSVYHFRIARPKNLHEVERNLNLLQPVLELPENFDRRIRLPLPQNFDLNSFGIRANRRPLIGIAPGSAWKTKRWPEERYAELAKMLKARGCEVLILGEQKEQALCSRIEGLSEGVINLCGRTSLKELFGIISSLDLLISNDSAAVHIASAFSTPVIVIFGPTVPEFGFGPWKTTNRIIQKKLDCRPCHHHGPRKCPEKHFQCMMGIEVEEVFNSALELLRERNF